MECKELILVYLTQFKYENTDENYIHISNKFEPLLDRWRFVDYTFIQH